MPLNYDNFIGSTEDLASVNSFDSSGKNDHTMTSIHSQATSARLPIDYSPDSGLENTTSSPIAFGYNHESSGSFSKLDAVTLNLSNLSIVKAATITTSKLRMFFQKNYTVIKEELDPDELADILYSKDLIRSGDREKIRELNYRDKRSDRLIKSLVRTSSKIGKEGEDKFVRQVITSFEEAKYAHVFNSFEEFKEPEPVKEIPIDLAWEEKLKYFFSTNGNDIDPLEVIDELLENEVVTFKEHTNIMDAVTSKNKRDCLLEAVLKRTRRHYDIFCNVIKEKNPDTSKMLFDESVCERMDISERCNSPNIEIKLLKETRCDDGETEVKLHIEGQDGPDNEFEAMIVDQHSPTPSESLRKMVTEDVHCDFNVTVSCILIALENYSERALMILIEKCKSSPKFLERWIKELFGADKMKKLKQRSTKELRFKIQVTWPEITLTKQDIARNYGYLKDVLEPQDYIDILNEEGVAKDVIKRIELSEAKEERAKNFLIFMVTSCNKDFMRKFTDHIKGTEVMSHLIKEKSKNCTRRCTCKLTKNVIVKTFSFLEEKLKDTDKIVDIFANCSYFSKSVREKFQAVLKKGTSALKNGALLNQILDLPDDGIQVCLLQDALLKTNQNDIINTILKTGIPQNGQYVFASITKEDVSRNMSFLKQELEPLRFLTMLENNDPKLKKILLERQSRKQRCELFLDYLQSCDTSKMESFSSELQRLQLSYVMDYLVSSRHQGYAEKKITKEDIIKNMCFLDDMIDPLELRHLLSGNEHDKSRTALGTVLSTSKKRRCKVFLEVMVDAEESIFNRFSTYLENEKPIAVEYLLNARETGELKDMSNIESLLDAYTCIIEEIEPNRFKTMFLEKQVLSHEDLELICSKSSRKGRAIALMEAVLKGPPSRAQCLIEALDTTGYNTLVNEIKHNQKKCNPCPRLYRYNLGSQNSIVFEGVVNIQFEDNFDNRYGSTSRILVTEASIVDSPVADSGFELSVNTPGSDKASRYTHRSSGYMTGSECDTPVTGSTEQNQTTTDLVSNGKETPIPMSVQILRKFIVKNFVLLKSEIDPVELIDTLCNEGVISSEIVEKLKNERLRAGKCDLLLKSISSSTYRNDDHDILSKVKIAFDSAGYGHLVKSLENELEKVIHETDESHRSKEERQKLDSLYPFDDDEIEPLRIIDGLVSEEILSLEEHQDIKIAETRKLRLNLLKDKMISKTGRDLSIFTRILKQQYSSLNEQLKTETDRLEIESLVDPKPTVHLQNTGKVCRIGSLVDPKPTVELNNTEEDCRKGYGEDSLVKMYFSCQGKKQRVISSPLDFDDRLNDVVMESGFEIVHIRSMNKIKLKSLSSIYQIEFLLKCCESVAFLEEWFQLIFIEEPIERLRHDHITEISVKIHINIRENQQVTCPCMLTKEIIFRHYSCLERNLESADEIIATFSKFKGFDESTQLFFKNLLDGPGNRTELFLLKLLDLSCTRIHLCLLEYEMRKKNLQLLKQVTVEQKSDTEYSLTPGHIRKNITFLSNELEPRHFTRILTGLTGSESILEKIKSNEPRQERCRTMIHFIIQKEIHRRFIKELERRNKAHLVEIITANRTFHGLDDIMYSLIKNYRRIIDEIEPNLFREIFVERRDITDIEYEGIRKLPTRRLRAKRLMRVILKGSKQIGKSFLDALEISGYSYLLKVLTTYIEPHKRCPQLFYSLLGNDGEFVITSRFELEFDGVPKTLTKEPALSTGHSPPLTKRDMRTHLIEENESLQKEAKIKLQRAHDWIKLQTRT